MIAASRSRNLLYHFVMVYTAAGTPLASFLVGKLHGLAEKPCQQALCPPWWRGRKTPDRQPFPAAFPQKPDTDQARDINQR